MKLQLNTAEMPEGYTICDNRILNSTELTADAKFIYIWLISKPADFRFFGVDNIARLSNMPYSSAKKAINQLIDTGLLTKFTIEHGRFGKDGKGREVVFEIFDYDRAKFSPNDKGKNTLDDEASFNTDKSYTDKSYTDKSYTDKSYTDKSYTDKNASVTKSPIINTQNSETAEKRAFDNNGNSYTDKSYTDRIDGIINKEILQNKENLKNKDLQSKEGLQNKESIPKGESELSLEAESPKSDLKPLKPKREVKLKKNSKTYITEAFNAFKNEIHHFTLEDVLEFAEFRDGMNKPIGAVSAKRIIKQLIEFGVGAYDSLNNSIMNGWQGIFPPKNINFENSAFARAKQDARHKLSAKYVTADLKDTKLDPELVGVLRIVKSKTDPTYKEGEENAN